MSQSSEAILLWKGKAPVQITPFAMNSRGTLIQAVIGKLLVLMCVEYHWNAWHFTEDRTWVRSLPGRMHWKETIRGIYLFHLLNPKEGVALEGEMLAAAFWRGEWRIVCLFIPPAEGAAGKHRGLAGWIYSTCSALRSYWVCIICSDTSPLFSFLHCFIMFVSHCGCFVQKDRMCIC